MARIIKIIGFVDKGSYGLVSVLLDDGTECVIYVGGAVEVFLHKGIIKGFVKRNKG